MWDSDCTVIEPRRFPLARLPTSFLPLRDTFAVLSWYTLLIHCCPGNHLLIRYTLNTTVVLGDYLRNSKVVNRSLAGIFFSDWEL